jgi:hypothetical protein
MVWGVVLAPGCASLARRFTPVTYGVCRLTDFLDTITYTAAGAHIWIKSDDPLGTDGASCFIHAAEDGEKTVYLPYPAKVTDLISKNTILTTKDGKSFKVKLRKHETRLYKFESLQKEEL